MYDVMQIFYLSNIYTKAYEEGSVPVYSEPNPILCNFIQHQFQNRDNNVKSFFLPSNLLFLSGMD